MNLTIISRTTSISRGIATSSLIAILFWFLAGTNQIFAATAAQDVHDPHFEKYTEKFFGRGFDWRLFKSQGFVESRLRQPAVSHRGAKGVMQIMPTTYRDIQKKNSYFREKGFDSAQINVAAGIFYDFYLYGRWAQQKLSIEMRMNLMLASYNAGFSRTLKAWNKAGKPVHDWDAVSKQLPRETRNYVDRILSHYEKQVQSNTVIAQRGKGCPIAATFERSFC